MYVCVYECMYREVYYRELAYMIMETDKSQNLQGEEVKYRSGGANGIVPI